MNKIIKISALVAALSLSLSLTGCGEETKKSDIVQPEDSIKTKVIQIKNEVVETKTVVLKPIEVTTTKLPDGKTLYAACAGCHGQKAERSALGKSKLINQMTEIELVNSMEGYKNGNYGGKMKSIMKGQLSKFSLEDIKVVSKYIKEL